MQYYAATAGGGAMALVFKEKDKPANISQPVEKILKNEENPAPPPARGNAA